MTCSPCRSTISLRSWTDPRRRLGSWRAAHDAGCEVRRCRTSISSVKRELVDAFLAAARGADFDALVAVLDQDVVLRIDRGARPRGASREVHGALAVAKRGVAFSRLAPFARRALVNGAAGLVVARRGRLLGVAGFTVARGRIVEIDLLMDPARLRELG